MKKGKIAIIFADAGLGHRRDAYNLYTALKQKGYNVVLLNFSDPKIIGKFFSFLWEIAKNLYEFFQRKLLLKQITKSPLTALAMQFYSFLISHKLINFIKRNNVRLLISTHPIPLIDLSYKKNLRTKIINLIPDSLSYLSVWFYVLPGSNAYYFVNDEKSKQILIKSGIKKEKIFVVGHILPLKETKKSLKRVKERALKIKNKKPLIFATTGGAGTNEKELKKIISLYIKERKGHLLINCNHHFWLFERLINGKIKGKIKRKQKIYDGIILIGYKYTVKFRNSEISFLLAIGDNEEEKRENSIKIFNKFLPLADILITKPSELSFYSCGIPIILFSPTNVVERSNRAIVLKAGYAVKFKKDIYLNTIIGNLKLSTIFFGTENAIKIIEKLM